MAEIASGASRRLADLDHVTLRSGRSVPALPCVCRDEGEAARETHEPYEAVDARSGYHRAGCLRCTAVPPHVSPEPTVVADAATNQLSLGEGVSLQMPGQTMSAPLESKPPAPWTAERDQDDRSSMTELPADADLGCADETTRAARSVSPAVQAAPASDNSGRVVPLEGQSASRKPVKKHTIHDGDTLESLAVRYLGDAKRAGEILEVNREVLSDPQLLPIGVAIVIPPDAAAADHHPADATVVEDAPRLVPLPTDGFRRGR